VSALTQGTVGRSGGSVSASDLRQYDFAGNTVGALGFAGTINGAGVVSGTLTPAAGPSSTVTFTPAAATDFDYHAPAILASVTGTWNSTAADGSSGSVVVSST
ncbi:hypothetical protein, partial [Salmonella enterica]|uniref:hypothetical protein n=1 Tax=Salmonella enterica TaxID=28901 RepID=UPI003FA68C25